MSEARDGHVEEVAEGDHGDSDRSENDDDDEDDVPAYQTVLVTDSNEAANAAITAACRGHVSIDQSGLMIDGTEIPKKRKRDTSEEEQDRVHDALYMQVSKLAKTLKEMRSALSNAKRALEPFSDDVAVDATATATAAEPAQTTTAHAENPGSGGQGTSAELTASSLVVHDSDSSRDATTATTATTATAATTATGAVVLRNAESDAATVAAAASSASKAPLAFVLSGTHKHAFLNRIRLCVQSWANKSIVVEKGGIVSCKSDCDFPHRLRWEKNGPPMRWVETSPRKTNLVVSMRSNSGAGAALYDDEEVILKHANALLPPGHPKLSELRFACYLVKGSAENGYDPASRPTTSLEKPLFKNPQACLAFYDNKYTTTFFHSAEGAPPVTKYTATMNGGKVVFKDVCFNDKCLTSNALNESDGVWRLCIRATHPGLMNLINFSVLTPPFCTGRRVRPVKIKKPKKKDGDDAEDDDSDE
jgi:hypothetical protein